MKKIFFVSLMVMLSTISLAKDLRWKNFNDGIAEAKKSGKKVLVDVYTDWCTWCKKMDEVTYSDKNIKTYLEKNYVLIKLNAEGNENISYAGQKISPAQFAQQMGIDGYPATLFLDGRGEPITVLPGYSEPKMFIHVLSFIGENQYKTKKFDQYLTEKGVK
ncbi:MAG: thioredoxin fold domain-containing protein [Bacteroidota bacterium]|nr:thioredoxin fold domain-containing protein [Bacteroidota bacterium]